MKTLFFLLAFVGGSDDAKAARWDFEDAQVGKLPTGWTSAKTGEGPGSVWKIEEDKSAPKGSKVLAQTSSEAPASLFNICVADGTNRADLDLSVSFKGVAGKKDQGGGPVWRYKDANNYYIARMNPLEENLRLYKVVDGKRLQLATADVEGASGKWHTIRIVHKGNRIQCFFNGKLHFDVKDVAFKEAGKVGFWTKGDAVTYFDNLIITKPIE